MSKSLKAQMITVRSNMLNEPIYGLRFFYLRSGFNYNKLHFIDKVLMTLLKLSIKWKILRNKPLTPDEIGMLEVYDKPVEFTKKSKIYQIITYVTHNAD